MALAVSTARVDITPQPGHVMAGYGAQDGMRIATDTRTALWARCVVLWDSGCPNVVVSADILGLGPSLNQAIRQDLAGEVADTDLVLLASHTHNGPALPEVLDPYAAYGCVDTTAIDQYGQLLRERIVALVRDALAAERSTVTLDYAVSSQSWSRNRAGLPYAESAVPVLTARAGSRVLAVLFSYGCHSVCGGAQTEWDGDYPAVAAATIEAANPDCVALFCAGPAGDQDPSGARGWALVDSLGRRLGDAVNAAVRAGGRPVAGPVRSSYRTVELPLDVTDTAANMAAVRGLYVRRLTATGQPAWYRRHAEQMIAAIDARSYSTRVPIPLQVWKLSGSPTLRLAFVGGELVSGYGAYFRARYGGPAGLLVSGYANECRCYLPSDELLPPRRTSASYEGGWDADFRGIAGGSMTVYGRIGHFRSGAGGVESTLINALTAQLG